MSSWVFRLDELLRGGEAENRQPSGRMLGEWGVILVLAGLGYGAVMGTFGGFAPDRLAQILYSAVKVPFLLAATFLVSLPSFFVLNTLLGVREDFQQVLGALVATQAGLTVVLLSLAPFTAFWYVSAANYEYALLFNGTMFAAASLTAQWVLHRRYQPLIARHRRHRVLLRIWLLIYVFVGIQMAWVLRPFVGNPNLPVQFFRSEAWGNAYEFIARMIWRNLTR